MFVVAAAAVVSAAAVVDEDVFVVGVDVVVVVGKRPMSADKSGASSISSHSSKGMGSRPDRLSPRQ